MNGTPEKENTVMNDGTTGTESTVMNDGTTGTESTVMGGTPEKESAAMAGVKKKKKRGRRIVPALLNIIGTLILVAVIASCLPVSVPKMMGYEIYNVVSGSMEPEIPVGSIAYVKPSAPEEAVEGDIIAFMGSDSVVIHRVVKNKTVEGELTTKGDANEGEDLNAVLYAQFIGKVTRHFPALGNLMVLYTSTMGKIYTICFAACGLMMNILAGRMRGR